MNPGIGKHHHLLLPLAAAVALSAGCASSPEMRNSVESAQLKLEEIKSDPQLADRAPIALREAEQAVNAAMNADPDTPEGKHLVFMAENKVALAESRALKRHYDDERRVLIEERDRARLAARTREAESAREEARAATLQAQASREESEQLRKRVEELNAKPTDRGLVLTLRDVLFEVNKEILKPGAHNDLDRLVNFLKEYDERDVNIQGHTDATGEAAYNRDLSERRAEAVKEYLVSRGIDKDRISTSGRGESMPVASNETAAGRQLNRRVEILIENPALAATGNRR